MLGRITSVVLICTLLTGCGRDEARVSTIPTSLPAGDTSAASARPAMGGAMQTSAGVVDHGGTAVAAVSPPATASGNTAAVSPPASATAGAAAAPH